MYVYKPRKKYPHVVFVNVAHDVYYTDVNPWCRENIGVYRKDWFCPIPRPGVITGGCPYAFKNKINAMAFMLRWV